MSFLRWLKNLIFAPKTERTALRFVTYGEAEQLLQQGWQIAPEEDDNRRIGWVWMERCMPVQEQP